MAEPAAKAEGRHQAYEIRHRDDVEWETIRWPGETGKLLFHPRPERPTRQGHHAPIDVVPTPTRISRESSRPEPGARS